VTTLLSLFTGIGGLDLGLERAGMTTVGQVEIDPFCRQVLARHWSEVPRHDDIRTCIQWWTGQPRPHVDVIAGGYPCQPESLAGRRRGTDDERWLWPDMARLIHAVRPRFVIGENVMGHRTRGLRFVLRDLDRLGYTARAGIVSAAEMGAPHRRQRIFVLAADTQRAELWLESGWRVGPDRTSATVAGRDGAAQHLADADSEAGRSEARLSVAGGGRPATGLGAVQPGRRGGGGPNMADTVSPGREPGQGLGWSGAPAVGNGWWTTEPNVGRVAHGIPGRVDRLRALGNACVPQVAEFVGQLLLSGAWLDD